MKSAPQTILHVVFALEPGGMENGLVNVAKALNPAEFAVGVCCLERAGEFSRRLPASIQVTVLSKPAGFSLATLLKLRRLFRQKRPALVHTHNLGPLIYSALALVGVPAISLLHGEHGMLTPSEQRPNVRRFRRWLYGRCAAVHTVSHALRQYYVEHGFPAEKLVAIANGVDTERFAPGNRAAARRQLGVPLDGVLAGMVGSLQRRKRHREVIEAFSSMAKPAPDARLLIVGTTGPESENLRAQIAASPVADRIHWLDYQEDPRSVYHALDLLVIASDNEGLSNAALEAMASGVPVLAGDACGNAEIISPDVDGFFASLGTPAAIAAQLVRLLAQPDRLRDVGERARSKVIGRFSMADMARGYADLYRGLIFR